MKLIRQERRHIVQSGRLLRKKYSGVDCACGKDLFALRLMGQGDDLVVTGEDDLVLADDGAASDGVDTDLVLGAFLR